MRHLDLHFPFLEVGVALAERLVDFSQRVLQRQFRLSELSELLAQLAHRLLHESDIFGRRFTAGRVRGHVATHPPALAALAAAAHRTRWFNQLT